jgi:hypothetical protein
MSMESTSNTLYTSASQKTPVPSVYRTWQSESKGRAAPFTTLHGNLSGVRGPSQRKDELPVYWYPGLREGV